MVQAAKLARSFVQDGSEVFYDNDLMRKSAVAGQIIRMAGHSRRLSDEFKQSVPDVPWEEIEGLGEGLVRNPGYIPSEVVRRFITRTVPSFILRVSGWTRELPESAESRQNGE